MESKAYVTLVCKNGETLQVPYPTAAMTLQWTDHVEYNGPVLVDFNTRDELLAQITAKLEKKRPLRAARKKLEAIHNAQHHAAEALKPKTPITPNIDEPQDCSAGALVAMMAVGVANEYLSADNEIPEELTHLQNTLTQFPLHITGQHDEWFEYIISRSSDVISEILIHTDDLNPINRVTLTIGGVTVWDLPGWIVECMGGITPGWYRIPFIKHSFVSDHSTVIPLICSFHQIKMRVYTSAKAPTVLTSGQILNTKARSTLVSKPVRFPIMQVQQDTFALTKRSGELQDSMQLNFKHITTGLMLRVRYDGGKPDCDVSPLQAIALQLNRTLFCVHNVDGWDRVLKRQVNMENVFVNDPVNGIFYYVIPFGHSLTSKQSTINFSRIDTSTLHIKRKPFARDYNMKLDVVALNWNWLQYEQDLAVIKFN